MATIKPFRGLRPPKDLVEQVASRPYDVLNSNEARLEAEGNEKSLYHIIRPEIDFPIGTETDKPCSIRLGNSLPPMNMSSVQKGKTSASMDATATRKRTCSAFSMMIRTKEHLRASTDFWILSVCAGPRPEPVRFRIGKCL